MVIIVKHNAKKEQIEQLVDFIEQKNVSIKTTEGELKTIFGLVGDTSALDIDAIAGFPAVESVMRVQEPYKLANRKFHESDSVIDVSGVKIGCGNFGLIAGPCSVESKTQVRDIAVSVKDAGANILRGGAFKPRTSPYAFQGLKAEGLEYLSNAKKETGMPIVSEIMSISAIPLFEDVDLIQVGARNMQNFELLKALGKIGKPILLKRGLSSTIEELLMSAEYIMAGGNGNVILCERGIRTFETATRNTLDISAVPLIKKMSHLPVVIDPSHATGKSWLVESMSLAAVAAGADGLMIEVHNNPSCALCDGAQSLNPVQFAEVSKKVAAMREFIKTI